uniref:Uncharacterized protein n=1 Tax=Anguilla anguilla TaxID=7936 RepID=A0A0E9TJ00_ANGAN
MADSLIQKIMSTATLF